MLLTCLLQLFSVALADTSQCTGIVVNGDDLDTVSVWTDGVTSRVGISKPSPTATASTLVAKTASMLKCSSECSFPLLTYVTSVGSQNSFLHIQEPLSFLVPGYFARFPTNESIRCVSYPGYCGAAVPLFRYYRVTAFGIQHAYSFSSDVGYQDFTMEANPVCYFWPAGIIANDTSGSLTDIPDDELTVLRSFDNHANGAQEDHYTTTLTSVPGYTEGTPLGKIATNKTGSCDEMIALVQMFDNQTGPFARTDHKLVVEDQEANRLFEQYTELPEKIYCSARPVCGATVPLWKLYDYVHLDSILSSSPTTGPNTYLYPNAPLCYIWDINYSTSGIVETGATTVSQEVNGTTAAHETTTIASINSTETSVVSTTGSHGEVTTSINESTITTISSLNDTTVAHSEVTVSPALNGTTVAHEGVTSANSSVTILPVLTTSSIPLFPIIPIIPSATTVLPETVTVGSTGTTIHVMEGTTVANVGSTLAHDTSATTEASGSTLVVTGTTAAHGEVTETITTGTHGNSGIVSTVAHDVEVTTVGQGTGITGTTVHENMGTIVAEAGSTSGHEVVGTTIAHETEIVTGSTSRGNGQDLEASGITTVVHETATIGTTIAAATTTIAHDEVIGTTVTSNEAHTGTTIATATTIHAVETTASGTGSTAEHNVAGTTAATTSNHGMETTTGHNEVGETMMPTTSHGAEATIEPGVGSTLAHDSNGNTAATTEHIIVEATTASHLSMETTTISSAGHGEITVTTAGAHDVGSTSHIIEETTTAHGEGTVTSESTAHESVTGAGVVVTTMHPEAGTTAVSSTGEHAVPFTTIGSIVGESTGSTLHAIATTVASTGITVAHDAPMTTTAHGLEGLTLVFTVPHNTVTTGVPGHDSGSTMAAEVTTLAPASATFTSNTLKWDQLFTTLSTVPSGTTVVHGEVGSTAASIDHGVTTIPSSDSTSTTARGVIMTGTPLSGVTSTVQFTTNAVDSMGTHLTTGLPTSFINVVENSHTTPSMVETTVGHGTTAIPINLETIITFVPNTQTTAAHESVTTGRVVATTMNPEMDITTALSHNVAEASLNPIEATTVTNPHGLETSAVHEVVATTVATHGEGAATVQSFTIPHLPELSTVNEVVATTVATHGEEAATVQSFTIPHLPELSTVNEVVATTAAIHNEEVATVQSVIIPHLPESAIDPSQLTQLATAIHSAVTALPATLASATPGNFLQNITITHPAWMGGGGELVGAVTSLFGGGTTEAPTHTG